MRDYRRVGKEPQWSHPHPDGPAFAFDLDAHQHPGEVAIGLTEGIGAVYGFAMRDVARRAHLGIAPDAYRAQLGETMAGLTRAAARNPHAWFREERSAEFLATPGQDNRVVAYPYTKHMVAIIDVDMAGALLVASEGWADANGIARERRVYPWLSCYAEDPVWRPGENRRLHGHARTRRPYLAWRGDLRPADRGPLLCAHPRHGDIGAGGDRSG